MKRVELKGSPEWKVLMSTRRSQAALMTIKPGNSEGGPKNKHPRSDQWMVVLSGTGQAIGTKRTIPLKAGALLLIEKGEIHEIKNTGKSPFKALNFYSPPAY
jgi:mannose-6-phosphate isomerase-like protein (cupin superfamily)